MSTTLPLEKSTEQSNVFNLDEYRKLREASGTWPPAVGTYVQYWKDFKSKKR